MSPAEYKIKKGWWHNVRQLTTTMLHGLGIHQLRFFARIQIMEKRR
jgi:hypothetical protein